MPLPVISNVYRCALTLTSPTNNQTSTTVFHFGAGATTALGVATAIVNAGDTTVPWSYVSTAYNLANLTVTKLDGSSASVEVAAPGYGGTQGGQVLYEAACVIKLSTALRGRSHRGRMYIGPLTEDSVNAGTVAGSTVSGIQAAFDDWKADIESDIGGNLKVASYKLASAENVTAGLVTTQQRTQRRRLRRVTH